ncbi:hypothetical protein FB45DRAFT_1023867 [Roridomyces roridus]|uniref:Uncharacterized protein n=1 Tax=Roridomyces roridus TaxID=1738132 RepID=A0AAD7C5B9_9AGAR|nr:hypothetical protein FB45DRAFT_1023867 [Roridomyces roridus]
MAGSLTPPIPPLPLRPRGGWQTPDLLSQTLSSGSLYLSILLRRFRFVVMDIRIILNPGAVGTPQSSSKVLKKTPRQGTPTSEKSYLGSATTNQRGASSRSSPASASSPRKSKTKTSSLVKNSSTALRQQPPARSPSTRQSRPRKRRVTTQEEEAEGSGANLTASTKKRRSSTQSHSSSNSASAAAAPPSSPSLSNLLLFRAKQQHARESVSGPPGSPRRSIMDVVMDMKGEESQEADVLVLIADSRSSERRGYGVLTTDEGIKAYWEDQAIIWHGVGGISLSPVVTHFPVSMERSTASAAAEEGEYLEV